jgi:hypothetical protein
LQAQQIVVAAVVRVASDAMRTFASSPRVCASVGLTDAFRAR